MKKFGKIFIVAAILLCGFAVSGCGLVDAVKDSIEDSYKQWYKYESKKPIDIPLVASEADDTKESEESNSKLKDAEIYFYFDPDNGLKVAIQSVTTQNVEVLGGLVSQQMDMVVGQTKQYPLKDFGKGRWEALYLTGRLKEADEPKISAHPKECLDLGSEDGPKIQWKKFLANYLLNKLIKD